MPLFYNCDIAFWLKMFTILLAGLNGAAFNLTGTRRLVEQIGAGEDGPWLRKLIAGSSLVLSRPSCRAKAMSLRSGGGNWLAVDDRPGVRLTKLLPSKEGWYGNAN